MTKTAAPATFAIGTCGTCGERFRADRKPARMYTPCPLCGTHFVDRPAHLGGGENPLGFVAWKTGKGRVTAHECDGACRSAKYDRCSCECGGRNHGASLGRVV